MRRKLSYPFHVSKTCLLRHTQLISTEVTKYLYYLFQNDKTRLKSIERNSKNEHVSEEFYKMIDKFKNVMETLENTANDKFRKVAENLLKETYKIIINVQLKTSNNLYGMFDKTIDEEN